MKRSRITDIASKVTEPSKISLKDVCALANAGVEGAASCYSCPLCVMVDATVEDARRCGDTGVTTEDVGKELLDVNTDVASVVALCGSDTPSDWSMEEGSETSYTTHDDITELSD